ncbi:d-amino acid oxidase [Fusarium subglutinans]|uniref:D-amino acid oxidase n=1 Tax=Gibberella subglutinans TaxID=42677 RepID=A0A8H5V394_GIBSU|nr:d-amino acid oxidase [Fusarium subglutinans]KAF5608956.1 d-amino acid oxidase [Fusarium subglutinans]
MSQQGETIVVVGAGVIGLSTALRVQEKTLSQSNPPSVVIIARDFPNETSINYATPWAGAHYRPCPGNTPQLLQEAVWAEKTYDTLDSWSEKDKLAAGVEFMPGEEFFEAPRPEYVDAAKDVSQSVYAHLKSSFELFSSSELSAMGDSLQLGFRYRSYSLNSPLYASFLQRRFQNRGGSVRKYILASLEEVFWIENSVKAVINCSGMGFGDPKVFPIRGQTCLVRNPISKTITRQNSDGSWSFAIPRPLEGGTIIGGTKEPHNWDPYPSADTRQTLLSNAAKWFPFGSESGRFDVVRDIVGRRPAREGGLRLELERFKPGVVVHAYGVGGRGLELSWGIADEVVSLLQKQGYFSPRAHL